MRARNQNPTFLQQWLRPVLVGTGVGILGCILLLVLMSLAVKSLDVPQAATVPLAVAAAAVGALVAGMVAASIARRKGMAVGAACGILLFLLILIAGFIRYTGVSGTYALVKLVVLTVSGALGGILGVNFRKR